MKQLVIEVTDLQAKKLKQMCPHGSKKPMFQAIIESLFEQYARNGRSVITSLIKKEDVALKELILNESIEDKMTIDLISIVSKIRTLVGLPKKTINTYSEALSELTCVNSKLEGEKND